MAMPKKAPHLARKTTIAAHVTRAERDAIGRLARRRGTTISTMVRDVLRTAVKLETVKA